GGGPLDGGQHLPQVNGHRFSVEAVPAGGPVVDDEHRFVVTGGGAQHLTRGGDVGADPLDRDGGVGVGVQGGRELVEGAPNGVRGEQGEGRVGAAAHPGCHRAGVSGDGDRAEYPQLD